MPAGPAKNAASPEITTSLRALRITQLHGGRALELVYYHDPHRNFGDDLNATLWNRILPEAVRASNRLVLIGIGSILNEGIVGRYARSDRNVAVLGTGLSYGVPPKDIAGWSILAVRGPLTAAAIGRPDAAVTDGAALLAASDMVPSRTGEGRVLFMPHHKSLNDSDWPAVARAAGVDYVDPRAPVAETLAQFGRARLVLAEAMHAAIVADTLRIPWVPLQISPAMDRFKWTDWTSSLDLPFEPLPIGYSSSDEMIVHRRLRRSMAPQPIFGEEHRHPEILQRYLEERFGRASASLSPPQPSPRFLGIRRGIKASLRIANSFHRARASAALAKAAESTAYLSDDRVFGRRLDQLQVAVRALETLA